MNKKLILAAIAVTLSVGCAHATNITGATVNGTTYTVKPEHFSGNAGYRKYDNFVLDRGHVVNLDFTREGGTNPDAFVNLVPNKVEINGLLNTVRGENFFNGHAIFITPGGFVVGQSGVLNVGRLSVATPSQSTYNSLLTNGGKNYGEEGFDYAEAIGRKVSKLTQNSNALLPAGSAEITINGKVFAADRVEGTGSAVKVAGNVVNGVANQSILTSEEAASALFENLVNTDGTAKAGGFATSGGRILLKSTDSMDVTGTVTNGVGDVYLTNNGANGTNVSGKVASSSDKLARIYNTAGKLELKNGAEVNGYNVVAQNKGTDLVANSGVKITAANEGRFINNGSGNLTLAEGSEFNAAKAYIINDGQGAFAAKGDINAAGELAMRNRGTSMLIEGNVKNATGKTAIRNKNGKLTVNAKVQNLDGNMGIINEGGEAEFSSSSEVTNNGKLKIANTQDATGDMSFNGKVENNGELRIYNDNGKLSFTNTSSTKNQNGKLYIAARKDATGITQAGSAVIENSGGNLVIRNSGTQVASGANGLDLKGSVKATNGTIAINNDMGNMYVSSNVQATGGNVGIINRAGGNTMTLTNDGNVTVTGGNLNIKNFGTGNMAVNSTITHDGRVNVLANKGALSLGSTVHNNSGALGENGGFYAASRVNGTGINVSSTFVVDGSGEVLIKNISGNDGLQYAGSINTTGNQAALVNHKGDTGVAGAIKTTNKKVIVSHKGKKLTVTSTANLNSGDEGILFDNGSETASISPDATLVNMKKHGKLFGQ